MIEKVPYPDFHRDEMLIKKNYAKSLANEFLLSYPLRVEVGYLRQLNISKYTKHPFQLYLWTISLRNDYEI